MSTQVRPTDIIKNDLVVCMCRCHQKEGIKVLHFAA